MAYKIKNKRNPHCSPSIIRNRKNSDANLLFVARQAYRVDKRGDRLDERGNHLDERGNRLDERGDHLDERTF
ncbi:hypothetical protein POVWA2_013590 [Plasmodium ovale wallikeri]|uniref:Uncharacterized protein n=1 Tax=Plasmodium ovale wallikeri TaxID=864142 RepID=A0A1A8YNN4_PLAOA|nr:hypothetical protein POVWA1_013380 [Plasmodium ovale wallikeri]SBT33205.1 hypothetical protein POVWA2_013590 [Plasmodium ovale wallikeri]